MNKTFKDYIKKQTYAIRDMLFSLSEATVEYDNTYELERALFEAINALVDFQIILEKN